MKRAIMVMSVIMLGACSKSPANVVEEYLSTLERRPSEGTKFFHPSVRSSLGQKLDMVVAAEGEVIRECGGLKSRNIKELDSNGGSLLVEVTIEYANKEKCKPKTYTFILRDDKGDWFIYEISGKKDREWYLSQEFRGGF